jgi:uncharacterized membrane protein
MMNTHLKNLFPSLVIAAALAIMAADVEAQPIYRVTEVGDRQTSGRYYGGADINDKGEVAGGVSSSTSSSHGFLWSEGGPITEFLAHTGNADDYMEVLALNNRSQITGVSAFRPFIWENGVMRELPIFPGIYGVFSWFINNWGQTIGTLSTGDDVSYRASADGNSAVLLEALPGHDATQVTAGQINDWGVTVGSSGLSGARQAVVWFPGTTRPAALNVLPGVTNSAATLQNNLGQIIVSQTLPQGERMTVWNLGHYTVPAGLHGADVYTLGVDINNAGNIVGLSYDNVLGANQATVWDQGVAYRVDDLISPTDPARPYVTIDYARKINNRGQILALGSDSRVPNVQLSYVLSPIPMP